MSRNKQTPVTVGVGLVALVVTLVLTGCGNSASPSESPSTIYPQSSPTGTLPALKAYLGDANKILDQVGTTVAGLPAAVKDMSVKPDATWTTSAQKLQRIAAQLGDEAEALSALHPPSGLQPVQDAVVKGIQTAQSGVQKLADTIDSGAQRTATKKAEVQSRVEQLKAQVDGLTQGLKGALDSLSGQ